MNKYMTAYKTNKYIDVLQDLIKNYNNTKHSTIGISPNNAHKHEKEIQKLNTVRYNEAIKEEQHFKVGDRVRCVVNLSAFEKRSLPRWSSTIHTIESKTEHSYTLDHGKTYKPYQLQLVSAVKTLPIDRTQPPREQVRKENKSKRDFKRSGLDAADIISSKRKAPLKDWAKDHLK